MKRLVSILVCFAAWNLHVQAGTIPAEGMVLSGDLWLTKRQHEILSGKRTLEEDETYITKWDKNADGLVVIPYTFDPNAGFGMKNKFER